MDRALQDPGQCATLLVQPAAVGFAKQALGQGADVVLFHEEMLLGCVSNVSELAEPLEGPTTRAFQGVLRGTPV